MSPERGGGEPPKDDEPHPYSQAARYRSEYPARRAYQAAQDTIHDKRNACDLSTYRFLLDGVWHVGIVGEPPPEDLQTELASLLAAGEPVELPEDVLGALMARREQMQKRGPWVERHYRPHRPR